MDEHEDEDSVTTAAADAATESAVIQQLLDVHPTQLTIAELVRELAGGNADFAERDAIERAVLDLDAVGLLHRNRDFVAPTRAALRLSQLLDR
jgi:hypothetical protein